MQQQERQQDEQLRPAFQREQQRLDMLAGKRLQQARAELLKQAGAEIRSAVAELNQQPAPQEVRLANKPGEAPLQRQASPQIMQAAKGDSPETLPQQQTTRE